MSTQNENQPGLVEATIQAFKKEIEKRDDEILTLNRKLFSAYKLLEEIAHGLEVYQAQMISEELNQQSINPEQNGQ